MSGRKSLVFESAVSKIIEKALLNTLNKVPFIILIAGCSRSGKSSLAQYLERRLTSQGHSTYILHLDNWITPASLRAKNSSVEERFNLPKLLIDVDTLLAGGEIFLHQYQSKTRESTGDTIRSTLPSDAEFVIIDGAVSLLNHKLRSKADLRIFVEVEKFTRLRRLISFYRDYKKLESSVYRKLIMEREAEEVPKINKSKVFADIIFKF
jgi:uridine kinase